MSFLQIFSVLNIFSSVLKKLLTVQLGMLLGLAIYNGVILDLHFPLTVYRKLLARSVGLNDLQEINPVLLFRGLCLCCCKFTRVVGFGRRVKVFVGIRRQCGGLVFNI